MQVYLITNKVNGKKYVGQTIRTLKQRWNSHVTTARNGGKFAISKAINKYGSKAFSIETLRMCKSRKELNKFEALFIDSIGTISPNGYNLTTGGESPIPSEETKKKQREAKLGMHISPSTEFKPGNRPSPKTEFKAGHRSSPDTEFKKGHRTWNKGTNYGSGESNSFFGKKHSEESKRKMRLAKLGKPRAHGSWENRPTKHGSAQGYKIRGCRCEMCKKYSHDLYIRTKENAKHARH